MAILAPLIAPLVGLGELGLVGEAIVGIGLSFGISYLSRELQPKSSTAAPSGMQLTLSYDPNEARRIPLGVSASAGALMYHNVYGPNGNDYVQICYRLGDVACDSLVDVYADGKKITLGSYVSNATVSGYTVEEFPDAMWIEFHDGAWDQAADSDLVNHATGTGFSTKNRGRGICYARVTMKYDAKLFKNGLPAFIWVFKGAKLYDWRKDSTAGGFGAHRWGVESTYEWTENPTVILYNWYRGITVNGQRVGGMNVPAIALPIDVWTASANACDETVGRKEGGTEKRYTMGGTVFVDSDNTTVCRDFVTSMAGSVADCGGVFKPYAGVSQASVLAITDDDIMWNVPVKYVPKRSRSNLVNAVFGSFNDPGQMYQSTALPPRISPDDETADGGFQFTENYGLTYVSSGTQGQRILEILRRQGRFQRNLSLTLSPAALMLESCDWISWTSRRYGFNTMLFRIVQGTINPEGTVPLEIVETSNDIFAWNPANDELDPANPQTVGSGGARFTTVQGVNLSSATITGVGDAQTPGLRIVWTPITDSTVTGLLLEYRETGGTVVRSKTIYDVAFGSYEWSEGILGGLIYEARLTPITTPARAVVSTSWVSTGGNTAPVVVDVAASANTVPDGAITPAKLSAQARLELSMATASAALQGSVNDRVEELFRMIDQAALASMGIGAINQSAVRITNQNLQTLTESFAQYQIEVNAAINDPETGIPAIAASVLDLESRVTHTEDGITAAEARVFLGVTVSNGLGLVTGGIDLYANAQFSSIGFAADRTFFTKPDGTGAKTIVTIGELADGSTGVGIDAEQTIIKGTVKAEHLEVERLDAISSHLGEVVTGKLRREDNLVFFDLDQGELRITTPQMLDLRFKVNTGYIPAFAH